MSTSSKISVIIPALKETTALRHLLTQLHHQAVFEIIVVQSNTASEAIKHSDNYNIINAPQGRGPQIQAGLDVAKGDIIWILHADSELPHNASRSVKTILKNSRNAMGCFPLTFNVSHPALTFFAWMSRFETPLTTFGDQGFFFRSNARNTLPNLTPYPLLEDVVLRRHLKPKGHIQKAKQPLLTDAKRFMSRGIWRAQWQNGWILLRFIFGTAHQKLYNEYYASNEKRQ